MYAVVSTGGKQLKVAEGDIVTVEKLDAQVGETVTLDVLFLSDGDTTVVDPAGLDKVKVTAEVVEHVLGEKVLIFKFKKRKGYKRTQGHRQVLTRIKVTAVGSAPKKAAAKKAAPKAEAPVEVAVEAAENE